MPVTPAFAVVFVLIMAARFHLLFAPVPWYAAGAVKTTMPVIRVAAYGSIRPHLGFGVALQFAHVIDHLGKFQLFLQVGNLPFLPGFKARVIQDIDARQIALNPAPMSLSGYILTHHIWR